MQRALEVVVLEKNECVRVTTGWVQHTLIPWTSERVVQVTLYVWCIAEGGGTQYYYCGEEPAGGGAAGCGAGFTSEWKIGSLLGPGNF